MDKVPVEEGPARVWQLWLGEGVETRTASLPGVGFIIPAAQEKKHVAQRGFRNLRRSPGLPDLNSGLCDSEIFPL